MKYLLVSKQHFARPYRVDKRFLPEDIYLDILSGDGGYWVVAAEGETPATQWSSDTHASFEIPQP